MPAPFYNAVKGTTSGAPGTGAFTPNAAASTFEPWSGVPVGWMGMVRYDDAGSAWERQYSYWNGTTLSRASTQFIASSTGSPLSLTSAATAAMVTDASEVQSHLAGVPWKLWIPNVSTGAITSIGMSAPTTTGTGAGTTLSSTNYRTMQTRLQITSATTANAQAGLSTTINNIMTSSASGIGGWEFVANVSASQLPTGPRLFAGLSSVTFIASTAEPSALVSAVAAFALDSTDTNIQLLTNDGTGGGTKIDTGIPFAVNGWYRSKIWSEPGSLTIFARLFRLDTGAIWFGSTTTDIPPTATAMMNAVVCGLNGTNTGTAAIPHVGIVGLRQGS